VATSQRNFDEGKGGVESVWVLWVVEKLTEEIVGGGLGAFLTVIMARQGREGRGSN
jgi:hypothetical protein